MGKSVKRLDLQIIWTLKSAADTSKSALKTAFVKAMYVGYVKSSPSTGAAKGKTNISVKKIITPLR